VTRVVGTDPGTSSLDVILLVDGSTAAQARFLPQQIAGGVHELLDLLQNWSPLDLIAAPSGYGLPLIRGDRLTEDHIDQMSLIRLEERGRSSGVIGLRSMARSLAASGFPVVFLPGGFHLPTIPAHRKAGSVDLGTADKVCVAALALWANGQHTGTPFENSTFAVVEVGSAFTAVLVVAGGRLVDAACGTRGPIGLRSRGLWDGEMAYWLCPLSKSDLFRGGLEDLGELGPAAFRESLTKHLAGLRAVTAFETIYLSGEGLKRPEILEIATAAAAEVGRPVPLPSLPGTWVKHAAQGSALLADALAGGIHSELARALELESASGELWSVLARSRGSVSRI